MNEYLEQIYTKFFIVDCASMTTEEFDRIDHKFIKKIKRKKAMVRRIENDIKSLRAQRIDHWKNNAPCIRLHNMKALLDEI